MATETEFKECIKILGKELLDISREEHAKLKSSFNAKFQSQLDCFMRDKRSEINQETLNHFKKEVKGLIDEVEKTSESLFSHSFSDEFDSSLLPAVDPLETKDISLWAVYLNQKLQEKDPDSKIPHSNARITINFKSKWKFFAQLIWKIEQKNVLKHLALFKIEILKKDKIALATFKAFKDLINNLMKKVLKTIRSKIRKGKGMNKMLQCFNRLIEKKFKEFLMEGLELSNKRLKIFAAFFKLFKKKIILERENKQVLIMSQKKLALNIFSLKLEKKLLRYFNRMKDPVNQKKKEDEIMKFKRQVSYLNLVHNFWIFRNYLFDQDKKKLIKRQSLAKLELMLKQLKYKAFWRLRTIVVYEYNIQNSTCTYKYITLTEKYLIPLKDNMKLILKQDTVYKVEVYDANDKKTEEFYTDPDFEKEIENKIDIKGACKFHLDSSNTRFCYGEFFERSTLEKSSQVEDELDKSELKYLTHNENIENPIEKMEKLDKVEDLKAKLKIDISASCLRSKTVEPSSTRNSRISQGSLSNRSIDKYRKKFLKTILIRQKIHEEQMLMNYFLRLSENKCKNIKYQQGLMINTQDKSFEGHADRRKQKVLYILKSCNRILENQLRSAKSDFFFILKTKNSNKVFKSAISSEQKQKFSFTFGKSCQRVMIKAIKPHLSPIFSSLKSTLQFEEKAKQRFMSINNRLNMVQLKAIFIWNMKVMSEKEQFEKTSPFKTDYILTDTNSEDSKDYDLINLQIANSVKIGFEKFIKVNENCAGVNKIVEVLHKVYLKISSQKIFFVFKDWKKGKTLIRFSGKMVSKYFFKVIIEELFDDTQWPLEQDFESINWQKMSLKTIQLIKKLNTIKNNQARRVFGYLVNTEIVHRISNSFDIIFRLIMKKLFSRWALGKASTKVKGTGMSSMKKRNKNVLRSARKTTKPFFLYINSLLSKQFRRIIECAVKRANEIKIQKHSLINLAKIVKKNISTCLNRWKIFKQKKLKEAKNLEVKKRILTNLFKITKKKFSQNLIKWKNFTTLKKIYYLKLSEKYSNVFKIFHKFLKIHLMEFKLKTTEMIKVEKKLINKNKSRKLRSGRPGKSEVIAFNKFKDVFNKFLRRVLARWRNNSKANKKISKVSIKQSLNTLRKNFSLHFKNIFHKWARNIKLSQKIVKPSIAQLIILKNLIKSRIFTYFNLIKQNFQSEFTSEISELKEFKQKAIKRLKEETLRILRNKCFNLLKVSFIRWLNLLRLSKAKLLVDSQQSKRRSMKSLMAPKILKAFGSILFLSFQNWKKFTKLTHHLPNSKKVIHRTRNSLKSLFHSTLRKYFSMIVQVSQGLSAKNCVLLFSSLVKQKLMKAFKKFQINARISKKNQHNRGLRLKLLIVKMLSNRMIQPVLRFGLGDRKLELSMDLIKRTMLLMHKAQLEKLKINSQYTKTCRKLTEKTEVSLKQAFIIFNGYGKRRLQISFNKLKKNAQGISFELRQKIAYSFVNPLNSLIAKKIKPLFINFRSDKQLKTCLNISRRLLQMLIKSYMQRWKENCMQKKIDGIIMKNDKNNRDKVLKMLLKGFNNRIKLTLAKWGLKARELSIKIEKREIRLEKILKAIVFPAINSSFRLFLINPEAPPTKQPFMLLHILDKYTFKLVLKKKFEILKSSLFSKKVQINNNLWQMKLSKERIKINKKCQMESQKGFSVNQLSILIKKNSQNLTIHAFQCFKEAWENINSKSDNFCSGIKKIRLVYLSLLKKNFDKYYYQIKWVAEKAMVSYAKSISKLIENFHKYDTRVKANYLNIWKNSMELRRLKQKFACMQIRRLKIMKPNNIEIFKLKNAFQKWKVKPDDVFNFRKLQQELEITRLKAKAYETELINLKKNRSFLYSGLNPCK